MGGLFWWEARRSMPSLKTLLLYNGNKVDNSFGKFLNLLCKSTTIKAIISVGC